MKEFAARRNFSFFASANQALLHSHVSANSLSFLYRVQGPAKNFEMVAVSLIPIRTSSIPATHSSFKLQASLQSSKISPESTKL